MARRHDSRSFTLLPPSRVGAPFSRRRFLLGVGLAAGAVAAAPLGARLLGRRTERLETSRPGLGTWIRIVVNDADPRRAERATQRAFAAIARVDERMSIHRPDSELSRVNAAAGRTRVAVSAELLDVVERARLVSQRSGGLYDPAILPLMRLWGFYQSGRTSAPSDREIAEAQAGMGPGVIALDRAAGTLGLTREGAALDLGSIGKGWAVDRAVDALRAEGVASALVDVGRNVYGLGTPDDDAKGWSVGVVHPVSGAVERVVTLRDQAVATSSNAEQSHVVAGRRVGHLLDALRGRPGGEHLSASVVADTGTASDAGSTLAFLAGPGTPLPIPGVHAVHFIG